jgi:hypothetical protein
MHCKISPIKQPSYDYNNFLLFQNVKIRIENSVTSGLLIRSMNNTDPDHDHIQVGDITILVILSD